MGTPRYGELIEFLEGYGIDARRVKADTMTASGYEYVAEYRDGRPMYVDGTMKLRVDWIEWPDKGVFETVSRLYAGQAVEPEVTVEQLPELVRKTGINAEDVPAAVEAATKLSNPAVKPTPKPRAKATK